MPNVTPLRPGDPRRVGRYRLTGRVDDFAAGGQDVFLAERVDGAAVMATFPGVARASDAAARDRFVAEAGAARNIPPFCGVLAWLAVRTLRTRQASTPVIRGS